MSKDIIKWTSLNLVKGLTLIIGVSILSYILITISPIDPMRTLVSEQSLISAEQKAEIAAYWGLDQGPLERFINWSKEAIKGNLGYSIKYNAPVLDIIKVRFTASLTLMMAAWLISGILGFALGVVAGAKEGSLADRIIVKISLILTSAPTFWVGLLLMMFFALYLDIFPIGMAGPIGVPYDQVTLGQKIHHLILPAMTLSIVGISAVVLHTRAKMIDAMNSDYALFAFARGESRKQFVWRHGLRNSIVPALTLQFASFSELFGGSVLAEQVFSYPGLGRAAVESASSGDAAMLLGVAIFSAIFVFVGNLIANIVTYIVNPYTREGLK